MIYNIIVYICGKVEREVSVWQQYRSGGVYADKVLDVFKRLIRPGNLIFLNAVHKKVNKNMSDFLETIKL